MKSKKRWLSLMTILILVFSLSVQSFADQTVAIDPNQGAKARVFLTEMTDKIGARVAGTEKEKQIADYMQTNFKKMGYKTAVQNFTYEAVDPKTKKKEKVKSMNVTAVKIGTSKKEIIVGAHMDSKSVGVGADDNGSALAVMLEVADHLKNIKTPYTIRFVAFGAEETGEHGSIYYVSKMSKAVRANTLLMVNMDSLAVGDNMYVYGGLGKDGLVRDYALKVAREMGLALKTNMGENPEYPLGTTGDWSDHNSFNKAGIKYIYFEATNWLLGDMDGYTQVDPKFGDEGAIWHTEDDNLKYIDENFPGRVDEHLKTFTWVLEKILTDYKFK